MLAAYIPPEMKAKARGFDVNKYFDTSDNAFSVDQVEHAGSLDDIPREVRDADLSTYTYTYTYTYTDAALAGRVAQYDKEALFERDRALAKRLKWEADRTRIEITRRAKTADRGAPT